MSENNNTSIFNEKNEEEISILDIVNRYLSNWQWMAISIFICTLIAFLYLRSTTPKYRSNAKVLIKDEDNQGLSSSIDILEDLGLSNRNVNLQNEIELFKSLTLMKQVSNKLNLCTRIKVKDDIINTRYGKEPISLNSCSNDSLLYNKDASWNLIIKNDKKFVLVNQKDDTKFGTFTFDKPFNSPIGEIIIKKTDFFLKTDNLKKYSVRLIPLQQQALQLKESITIVPVNEDASVLRISMEGTSIKKNNAIINSLIQLHEQNVIDDKREITKTTSDFINDRIKVITQELSLVEEEGQNYKTDKNLTNLQSDGLLFSEKNKELEVKIMRTAIEKELAEYMNSYLDEHNGYDTLLPSNLGFTDASIASTISQYNLNVLKRNRLLKTSNTTNPLVIAIEGQISDIKTSLKSSLENMLTSLKIKLNKLYSEQRQNKSKISSIPEYEREYRSIVRQQQIKENLYLYLLQKREENEIAMAATLGNTIIIDEPYSSGIPVSPNKKIIFLSAFLIGLMFPIGIIYFNDLLDNKIRSVKDLENIPIPLAGDIPTKTEKGYLVVSTSIRSSISEAFRMLRTNINFLLHEKTNNGRVILVTSAIKGEGKTFIAYNLANSLSLTKKKVLIMGMDLRAPKLTSLFKSNNSIGITNYLIDHKLKYEDIVQINDDENKLNYITSGPVPPNPSELLHSARMIELIDAIRKDYDYIIVDTAPIGIVADTQLIAPFADLTLFVARANYADKRLMEIPKALYRAKKIKNVALILNDIKQQNRRSYYGYGYGGYGYGGYGYGYGYGEDEIKEKKKRSFLNRFKREKNNKLK